MEKIPTLEKWSPLKFNGEMPYNKVDMIEFAKMHVEAALKEASETVKQFPVRINEMEFCEKSILNSYPLENIK